MFIMTAPPSSRTECENMEITNYVVSGRDQALLYGDYSTYRAELSNRLLSIRKRLGRATKKGAKYSKKCPVTAEDIASNVEFVHLQLSTAERAWAHAMSMKSTHSTDAKGITGATRSHIISRLHKASTIANELLETLRVVETTKATETDALEIRAYATSLKGAEEFEKQSWETCIKSYSVAWVLYSALDTSTQSDLFQDLISKTIEPSITYGAYQMRMPRTIGIPVIARKYFPKDEPELAAAAEKLDPSILRDPRVKSEAGGSDSSSRTITWRSRTVDLEDASIVVALTAVATAQKELSESLFATLEATPKERAAAYDGILIASQDAVDATKHAIDDLIAEGVVQGDKRIQSLQITRTAVSYDMISWRIGRNRVLTGEADGSLPDNSPVAKPRLSKKAKRETSINEQSSGRKMARLREQVVMYDSTLQSLDSIRELSGVAADTAFMREIEAKYSYFRALKCFAIARSHDVISEHKNALALLARASEMAKEALPVLSSLPDTSKMSPPNLSISPSDAESFANLLEGELQRHRALVELSDINNKSLNTSTLYPGFPLVERLNTYPSEGVDLTNLVTYPPKLEPIPVKPLFFDLAWNYIQYPGQTAAKERETTPKTSTNVESKQEQSAQQKKGWFGFGR